jgi:hypothetical protein
VSLVDAVLNFKSSSDNGNDAIILRGTYVEEQKPS